MSTASQQNAQAVESAYYPNGSIARSDTDSAQQQHQQQQQNQHGSMNGSVSAGRGGGSSISADDDDVDGHNHNLRGQDGTWPVTADNLGRIPQADQLAPGIRLPNSVAQEEGPEDDDDEQYGHGGAADGLASRRKIGPTHVGHFGPHGAPVPGVPPELDPRAAKFRRPTSPGAASVFSLAVQPPASPKAAPIDGDGTDNGAYVTTPGAELPSLSSRMSFSLPSPSVNSSSASIFSGPPSASLVGGLGTPMGPGPGMNTFSPSMTGIPGMGVQVPGVAASIAATAGSSSSASSVVNSRPNSIRAPSPPLSVVSAPGSDVSMGPPSATASSVVPAPPLSASSGFSTSYRTSGYQAGPSMLSRQAALVSHAPSEVGSVESSSSLDAPLSTRGGGIGSNNGDGMDMETDARRPSYDDEDGEPDDGDVISRRANNIERQRMRERELLGGEAGVGGLSSRPPAIPSLATLMRQDRTAGGFGSGISLLSPSRPGSTAATIGTASPPQSTISSSDEGHEMSSHSVRRDSGLGGGHHHHHEHDGGSVPSSPLYGRSQMQTPPLRPSPAFAFEAGAAAGGSAAGNHPPVGSSSTSASRSGAAVGFPSAGGGRAQGELGVPSSSSGAALGTGDVDFAHRSRRSSIESTETIASSHRPVSSSSGASDRDDGEAGGAEYWPVGARGVVDDETMGSELRQVRLEETVLLDGPQIGFGKPGTPTGEERMQF
ncbi:hypothetical protein CF326_g2478 [Tilletia indica]|nr:hypothetical protein CF326_g2478 [Tilletia indica]